MSILAALLLVAQPVPEPTEPLAPEALLVFQSREQDLVTLAGQLGRLHRLNQICPGYGSITVFRDRMKDVIDGERPRRETREGMISNFNQGYRDMTEAHFACSAQAEADFRNEAIIALSLSERLSAPLPLR